MFLNKLVGNCYLKHFFLPGFVTLLPIYSELNKKIYIFEINYLFVNFKKF